jgi:DNA-binding XRE family transcriptional regulator
VTKIRTALEKAGVEFTNGRKPGAKLNPKIAKYPDSSSDAKGLAEDVQAGDPFADMVLSPSHCRMARAALQIGIRDLAKLAKVSPNTISRLERGEALNRSTLEAIQRAFTKAGVELIPENGGGAGVRLQRKSSQR